MFDLARELVRLDDKVSLFTAYPSFKIEPSIRKHAKSHSMLFLAAHLQRKLRRHHGSTWLDDYVLRDFGRWMARQLSTGHSPDVLDALDGTALEAGRVVQKRGGLWVCNRGSTHILTQRAILIQEYARWRIAPPDFSPGGISRCLTEYEEADAIVVPSEFCRRSFQLQGIPAAKIYKCPYGVDLSLFVPSPKEPRSSVFRVLFLGTASIRKGIGHLLDALEPLTTTGRVELWLIGHIAKDAEPILGASRCVYRHLGVHPRDRLAALISQCDVLVLPSLEEGLALVIAQAMACGLPVIASASSGAEELVADGVEGFILREVSSMEIRRCVLQLLEDEELTSRMGQAAIARTQHLGGWRTYGSQVQAMYHSLISNQHGRIANG